jgi:hypothetical protein
MRGVMFISGYRGIGKSFLAAQADAPTNILYLDYEEKAEGINDQLGLGEYHSVYRDTLKNGKPDLVSLYTSTQDIIDSVPHGRFTVAILDNISPLEAGMKIEVQNNVTKYAKEFGLNAANVSAGRFGGASQAVNFMVTSRLCMPLYAKGIRLIIATAHIKSAWSSGGPIPNKFNVLGADRWQELSILTLILVPGEHAPIPAALVQKEQLGLLRWDESAQEHIVQRRLPTRIPKCNFAEIRRYLREPANLQEPAPGERPKQSEIDTFSSELSREQLEIVRMALRAQEREESLVTAQEQQKLSDVNVRIKELAAQGMGFMAIRLEVNKEFNMELSPGDVRERMNGVQAP